MKNKNKGENMKTKKIVKGWYEVTYNNNKYEVEQNFELFDNGWQLMKDGEIIDTGSYDELLSRSLVFQEMAGS